MAKWFLGAVGGVCGWSVVLMVILAEGPLSPRLRTMLELVGLFVAVGALALVIGWALGRRRARRLDEYRQSLARCKHGVARGIKCDQCYAEDVTFFATAPAIGDVTARVPWGLAAGAVVPDPLYDIPPAKRFRVDQWVRHARGGLGIVTNVDDPNYPLVVFGVNQMSQPTALVNLLAAEPVIEEWWIQDVCKSHDEFEATYPQRVSGWATNPAKKPALECGCFHPFNFGKKGI